MAERRTFYCQRCGKPFTTANLRAFQKTMLAHRREAHPDITGAIQYALDPPPKRDSSAAEQAVDNR